MKQIIIKQNEDKTFTIEDGYSVYSKCDWRMMIYHLVSMTLQTESSYHRWKKWFKK